MAHNYPTILDNYNLGNYKECLKQIKEISEQNSELNLLKSQVLNKLERYQEAIDVLQQYFYNPKNSFSQYQKWLADVFICYNYIVLGKHKLVNDLFNLISEDISGLHLDHNSTIDAINFFIRWNFINALLQRNLGNNEEASGYIKTAFDIAERYEFNVYPLLTASLYNEAGNIHLVLGNFEYARQYYNEALKVRKKIDNKLEIAASLNNLGIVSVRKGDLDQATEYFSQCIEIYQRLRNRTQLAQTYNNLGYVFEVKHNLDKAQQYLEMSIALNNKVGNPINVMNNLNNLAKVFLKKDEYRETKQILDKVLQMNESGNNVLIESEARMTYVFLAYELKDAEIANEQYAKLQAINSENKQVQFRTRMSKAILLRFSNRIVAQADAQRMFKSIIEDIEVSHDYKTLALIHTSELLLMELQSTNELEEVVLELMDVIKLLTSIAHGQNNFSLVVESLLLQSKLALLGKDLSAAKYNIEEAIKIALERDLTALASRAKSDMESLNNELDKWEQLITQDSSIEERLQHTDVLSYMKDVVKQYEIWL